MAFAPSKTVLDEITDFLNAEPTPEEIIAYRLPEMLEARAHELLERNRASQLSLDERQEMEQFMWADRFMTLLKAKARLKLSHQHE